MKKIAVITATRAEYGLLKPVIMSLREYESSGLKVDVVVTGTHLNDNYGYTVNEIEKDNVRIDYKIYSPVNSGNPYDISSNQAEVLIKFTKLFMQEKYNAVLVLGDRYEILAIAAAAGNTNTPLFHMCGGDTTEGASDEWIRHSVTKMSYIHFVTNEDSRRRVIQLGENPGRVFNYGSTSIDNIINTEMLSKKEVLLNIGITECCYAICTYHPVTIGNNDVDYMILQFLEAVKKFPDIEFIVTKSNADRGGARINILLEREEKNIKNLHVFASLGVKRYLSLVKHSMFVLGNSSSGIIEAPVFHVPSVNIGDRQRGRLQCGSIINCGENSEEIINAIYYAMSEEFRSICLDVQSPYGTGNAAKKIACKIIKVVNNECIDLKKKFYDL